MSVDDLHQDYSAALPRWRLVDDIADERNLAEYVYNLDVTGDKKRNDDFKQRASFTGVTGFTEAGLVGIAYDNEPEITLPATLEYLRKNVDGAGLDFAQQILAATGQVLRKDRAALFVTYPARTGDTSVAEQRAGKAVATIQMIRAERVINWWTTTEGATTQLAGVVFTDTMETRDGFDVERENILRSLTLEGGLFVDQKWRKDDSGQWQSFDYIEPLKGDGSRWASIPFTFIGGSDNTPWIRTAPLYPLAKKNADHLNNSAINERTIWFAGHIQPVADEIDPAMFEAMAGEAKFEVGSGNMLVAKGFRYEVANANTAARQGMLDKFAEMQAIGARILQPGTVAKTATQAAGEEKVSHSILSLAVVNVEDAYNVALAWCVEYMRCPEAYIALSRDFMLPAMVPEMLDRLLQMFDRGLIGTNEVHRSLTRAKIVDPELTADEYRDEVDARGGGETMPDMGGGGLDEPQV